MNKLTYSPFSYTAPAPVLQRRTDTLNEVERLHAEGYADTFPQPVRDLVDIHTYCRPHNSATIDDFVRKFITSRYHHAYFINNTADTEPYAVVVETDPKSRTMFSAHVDTVHGYSGRQIVEFDAEMGLLLKPSIHHNKAGDCLGADDGAGVWLLLQMIEAGVPGVFVFHYGEERGGIGSSGIADEHEDFLKRFDRAVAFDRKGSSDVITHQGMGRCCSNKFADELANRLNVAGERLTMAADNGGIFTDTANYTHVIPECTNIACGYDSAHTAGEYLDTDFLLRLKDALVVIDWETLPTLRDPSVVEYVPYEPWGGFAATSHKGGWISDTEETTNAVMEMRFSQVLAWVKGAHTEDIAEVIYELIDRVYAAEDAAHYENVGTEEFQSHIDDDEDDYNRLDVGMR